MTFTRVAVVLGALVVIGLCVLAATGVSAAIAPLITLGALVALVGGGNWLTDRMGLGHRPPPGPAPPRGSGEPPP